MVVAVAAQLALRQLHFLQSQGGQSRLQRGAAGRYRVDNTNAPSRPRVSEPVEADLEDNLDTIKVLVSTLG